MYRHKVTSSSIHPRNKAISYRMNTEQASFDTTDDTIELEKVLVVEPIKAAEEPAVRVQLNNGSTVPVKGAEEVQEFMEALEEHLDLTDG